VPDGNGSLWATWEPDNGTGLRVGAGVRYVGKSVSENNVVRYETSSYTLGDFMVGYEINDNLDFALNILNVTDKEYLTSCLTRGDCFPGLRRSINAKVTYNF
jgi:iron complex outermembrane receptor protein